MSEMKPGTGERHLTWMLLLWMLLMPGLAGAHLAGITDTSIQVGASQVKIVYTFPTDSLRELSGFNSAEPSDEESARILEAAITQGFKVSNNNVRCEIVQYKARQLARVESRQFALLYDCGEQLGNLDIVYTLFVDRFPDHENFVRVSMGGKYISRVFSAAESSLQVPVAETLRHWDSILTNEFLEDPNQTLELTAKPAYFTLGIEHILLGFDHLLFLFALLLLPLGLRQLLAMITAFTVAHSITLALAVFGLVSLPVSWVEAVIALSIVYVGAENLLELKTVSSFNNRATFHTPWKRRVLVTFCFGLIHGFGFSYVLREIGLGDQVASALLFFNLGVEAGQLLAVALVYPLLLWLFQHKRGVTFSRLCSLMVILMGSVWLVERVMAAVG